jgi:hypothetical protein
VSDQGGHEGISWEKPNQPNQPNQPTQPQQAPPQYPGQPYPPQYPGQQYPGQPSPPQQYLPPQYGGQPPQYGAQPSQYGAQPPQYGAQPPQYGAPNPYGQQPQWGQQPSQWGPYGYPPVSRSTNAMAIASLVLGILWIWWIGSVLALIFGYIAKSQIKERNENGGGLATAGIVLGWIGVAIFVIAVIAGVASDG